MSRDEGVRKGVLPRIVMSSLYTNAHERYTSVRLGISKRHS